MEDIYSTMYVLDATPSIWKILIRIGLAILAGFLIGLENRARSKEAGLKTHTILCLTASVLMVISKYAFYDLAKLEGIQYDASRVAANILTGLCFLGAGMFYYRKATVQGLTSAVSICLTIAIGMCFGSGLLITGGVVTVLTIVLQIVLHSKVFKTQKMIVCRAKFVLDNEYIEHFKQVVEITHFNQFRVTRENEQEIVEVEFYYRVKKTSEELLDKVNKESQIMMFEKIEER